MAQHIDDPNGRFGRSAVRHPRRRFGRPVVRDPRADAGVLVLIGALAVLVICLIIGLGVPHGSVRRASAQYPVTQAAFDAAKVAFTSLVVASDRAAGAPAYSREKFGRSWQDTDRNGCDTRNDILARDLLPAIRDGPDGCTVSRGTLRDPYTGTDIEFERGPGSAAVQIDHVVALADAWRSGAWQWDLATRTAFANDPDNLLAVDGTANRKKGAATADEWLPPNVGFACVYAIKQITVKARFSLSVADAERNALQDALGSCSIAEAR